MTDRHHRDIVLDYQHQTRYPSAGGPLLNAAHHALVRTGGSQLRVSLPQTPDEFKAAPRLYKAEVLRAPPFSDRVTTSQDELEKRLRADLKSAEQDLVRVQDVMQDLNFENMNLEADVQDNPKDVMAETKLQKNFCTLNIREKEEADIEGRINELTERLNRCRERKKNKRIASLLSSESAT